LHKKVIKTKKIVNLRLTILFFIRKFRPKQFHKINSRSTPSITTRTILEKELTAGASTSTLTWRTSLRTTGRARCTATPGADLFTSWERTVDLLDFRLFSHHPQGADFIMNLSLSEKFSVTNVYPSVMVKISSKSY
jgi:hypothetical protein